MHTTKHTTKEKHNRFVCLLYIYKYVYIHIDIWRLYAWKNIDVSYVIYVCIITQQHALFCLEISAEQSTSSPAARYWFANSQVKHIDTYLSHIFSEIKSKYPSMKNVDNVNLYIYIYLKFLFFSNAFLMNDSRPERLEPQVRHNHEQPKSYCFQISEWYFPHNFTFLSLLILTKQFLCSG